MSALWLSCPAFSKLGHIVSHGCQALTPTCTQFNQSSCTSQALCFLTTCVSTLHQPRMSCPSTEGRSGAPMPLVRQQASTSMPQHMQQRWHLLVRRGTATLPRQTGRPAPARLPQWGLPSPVSRHVRLGGNEGALCQAQSDSQGIGRAGCCHQTWVPCTGGVLEDCSIPARRLCWLTHSCTTERALCLHGSATSHVRDGGVAFEACQLRCRTSAHLSKSWT